ncbi:MAG: hypothetical protein J6P89_04875, partial [Oscillospiraceae bacterium]|nr:hypothetical protein [Oscillospiraceae bacterium]
GLSISEKMRKQIRGLTQASANAQDGISAVQTAEGALNEVQDMLQRMNELAVKAANGTNSTDDRTYIQNEIDQLVSEIDRVAETTKFNETYLLKGTDANAKYSLKAKAVTDAAASATFGVGTVTTDKTLVFDGVAWFEEGSTNSAAATLADYGVSNVSNAKPGDKLVYDATSKKAQFEEANFAYGAALYDENGNRIPDNGLEKYFDVTDAGVVSLKANTNVYIDEKGTQLRTANIAQYLPVATKDLTDALTLKLHVGADATSNNQISVTLESMSAKSIGVKDLKVDGADDTNARYAIETIKAAIQKISTQRSALGAVQNRLDHTINNLDNVVENTTSAESGIRDTDMATEMVRYSNNNILAQAGQSMLAQANQTNQGVLSLLG